MEHALEEEPFAHETAEGWKGRDGQSPHQEDGAAHRHPLQQATEPVKVCTPGGLLYRTRREEERTLEDGVKDDVKQCGDECHDGERRMPGGGKQA